MQALTEKQKAALDSCAARLEPLWVTLSQCISRIEEGLGQQTPHQEQAHLLPPEAAQVRCTFICTPLGMRLHQKSQV